MKKIYNFLKVKLCYRTYWRQWLVFFAICFLVFACNGNNTKKTPHNHESKNTSSTSLSPLTYTMVELENTHIHLEYSSPSVRKRIIFGGLLAFNQIWQAGAHNATWFETDNDIIINDINLEKGKYGIFMIPRKYEDWTIIFNTRWNQHGKDDYNPSEDVIRFDITPITDNEFNEKLIYKLDKLDNKSAKLSFAWESTKIEFDIKL